MAKRAHDFRSDRLSCDLKGQALTVAIMLELDWLEPIAVWLLAGFMHIPGPFWLDYSTLTFVACLVVVHPFKL
jgi:hypothetical protein